MMKIRTKKVLIPVEEELFFDELVAEGSKLPAVVSLEVLAAVVAEASGGRLLGAGVDVRAGCSVDGGAAFDELVG